MFPVILAVTIVLTAIALNNREYPRDTQNDDRIEEETIERLHQANRDQALRVAQARGRIDELTKNAEILQRLHGL